MCGKPVAEGVLLYDSSIDRLLILCDDGTEHSLHAGNVLLYGRSATVICRVEHTTANGWVCYGSRGKIPAPIMHRVELVEGFR